jgi:hypothetical protein
MYLPEHGAVPAAAIPRQMYSGINDPEIRFSLGNFAAPQVKSAGGGNLTTRLLSFAIRTS